MCNLTPIRDSQPFGFFGELFADLNVEMYKLFPAKLGGVSLYELAIDPTDVGAIIIDGTTVFTRIEIFAGAVAAIQENGLVRPIYMLTA